MLGQPWQFLKLVLKKKSWPKQVKDFIWIHMDLYESYVDLHWLLLLLIDFALGLIDVYGFMLIYMPSNYVYTCFCRVYELGVAYKRAAGFFFFQKKKNVFPDFWTCQFWKTLELSEFH